MKLTKRETLLLFALAFMVVNLIAFSFVLSPLYQSYLSSKLLVSTVQQELQDKLNVAGTIGSLRGKEKELQNGVVEAKIQQLELYAPEEMDAYLYEVIQPFTDQWSSMMIGEYEIVATQDEVLSYAQKAEVSVNMDVSEEVMIQVMQMIQESGKMIGIKDVSVVKQSVRTAVDKVSFVIEFYTVRFE